MPETEQTAKITATAVETNEEVFVPPAYTSIPAELEPDRADEVVNTQEEAAGVFAVLEPIEQENKTTYSQEWLDFYRNYLQSPYTTYTSLPSYEEEQKRLVINIETTAVNPWEARLICIGVLDPSVSEPTIQQFLNPTEEETIKEFVDWINSTSYSELVGYNVSFDYRFLYALMQRYRLVCPAWLTMDLYDLQVQQKQVKQSYVSSTQKAGTLEQWCTYLLGTQPYAEQKKVYEWLKAGNTEEILAFNEDKVTKSYLLYTLNKVVAGTIIAVTGAGTEAKTEATASEGRRYPSATESNAEIQVKCPSCLSDQFMYKSQKAINCFVCGTPIANPML